tara:strand:+ start:136 stop:291 length:156 start_codon:yes stop_codon:yes gene_type:complete
MLTFLPSRTDEDVLKEIIEIKNKQSLLKIKENKLIDELIRIKQGENDAENN